MSKRKENVEDNEQFIAAAKKVNIGKEFVKIQKSVERAGSYSAGGKIGEFELPGLQVSGVGHIGLPLCEFQAKQIIQKANLAPFGRGEETIHDTSVRNTWQLDPSEFSINNPDWNKKIMGNLIGKLLSELGVDEYSKVSANLYKLLLYEQGGFFKRHRDTEKEDTMFATLVIMLPSLHEGGQLEVYHGGHSKSYDFGPESIYNLHYISFYADCEHEIRPVISGYRLALTFQGQVVPTPSNNEEVIHKIISIIKQWRYQPEREQIAIMLDHKYSQAGLSFVGLKGRDRAFAQLIKEAIKKSKEELKGIELEGFLGQVKLTQSGTASYSGYGCEPDLDEVEESECTLRPILDLETDSKMDPNSGFDLDVETDVFPEDFFENEDPVHNEVQEATGNAGASIERWYKHSALLLSSNFYEDEPETKRSKN